nr:acyl-CoA dehydrogenase family protein [Aeromicrobium wangtongii]
MPIIPREEVVTHVNWDVVGLQATASWDYEFTDVFVPHDQIVDLTDPKTYRAEPTQRIGFLVRVWAGHTAVALGFAKRALGEVATITLSKTRVGYGKSVADSDIFKHEFAQRVMSYEAARAVIVKALVAAEEEAGLHGSVSAASHDRLRVSNAWVAQVSDEIVQWAYSWSGSVAVRRPSEIANVRDDSAVAATHLYVDRINLVEGASTLLTDWATKSSS